ncbi:MAG: hypothetical protein AAFU77_17535 [Myxococcota bacterium]
MVESDAVRDVVLVDGRVDVSGMVEGHLYALDSDVFVRNSAGVVKSLTVFGGSLHLEANAVLPERIDLWNADYYGPKQSQLAPGRSIQLASGTEIQRLPDGAIVPSTHQLTKSVLGFDRPAPADDDPLDAVFEWSPGLGLERVNQNSELASLDIGGLLRLRFVSDRIVGAVQQDVKGPRGAARLTAVKLASAESAAEFWQSIAAVKPPSKLKASVKSDLGDGAHWFFVHRDRSTTVWQRGGWVLALESTLFAEGSSVLQHHQFNRQLLASLRNTNRNQSPGISRGVTK